MYTATLPISTNLISVWNYPDKVTPQDPSIYKYKQETNYWVINLWEILVKSLHYLHWLDKPQAATFNPAFNIQLFQNTAVCIGYVSQQFYIGIDKETQRFIDSN